MSPEWILRNRGWIITRLRFDGHHPLRAEQATDLALGEIENRVRDSGWRFHGESSFRLVWLRRARLRALDLLRRDRHRPPATPPGVAHSWRVLFRLCFDRLEEEHRRVLEMYYWERRRDPEIGQILWPQEPPSTTTPRAHRTRHAAQAVLRAELLRAGMDAKTLDFDNGPFGRLGRDESWEEWEDSWDEDEF